MKIDVILQPGTGTEEAVAVAQAAEQAGVHAVWASSFPGCPDPFLLQSAVAAATNRVRLGVMPISPWEIHPVKQTDQLHTLNEQSNGRAQILVGGMGKSVMNATGLTPVRRLTAVSDCLTIMQGVNAESPLTHEGQVFSAFHYILPWARAPKPRVYLGANGPRMLAIGGRQADGVMLSDVTTHHLPESLEHVAAGRNEASGLAAPAINNFWAWHVKADPEAAEREARQELVWRGALQKSHTSPFLEEEECDFVEAHFGNFLQAFLNRTHEIEGVPESIITRLLAGLTFTGGVNDIDGIIERMRALEAAGQTEIALRLHREPLEAVKLIGEHVVPALDG